MTESESIYEPLPVEMIALKQWVIWGVKEEKPKIPYNPLSPTVEAKANDAATWGGFEEAVAASSALGRGGIGFEFGAPGDIAGLDLDHVINDAGALAEWARDIVLSMDSYTEYSPSGHGLHILFKIKEPLEGFCVVHKRTFESGQAIEVYDTGRYFTVTGRVYGEAKPLNERTEALKKVCARYLAKTEEKKPKERAEYSPPRARREGSAPPELWEQMFNAPNGRDIQALYHGDISGYGSKSEADLALCNHLAFWTGHDAQQMDMMFRASGLMREKWDEQHGAQTYGSMTIARAIRDTPEYTPPAKSWKEASTDKKKPPSLFSVDAGQLRPVSEYLNDFLHELLKSREGHAVPTGFNALDKILDGGLYPGLYFVGAISSLGKTTFALQIGDNIAKNGHEVLIFSLEMSRSEMMAKTLSRESLQSAITRNGNTAEAMSTRGILRASFHNEKQETLVRSAIEEYSSWGSNLIIIEGIGDVGTTTIRGYVERYMTEHEGKPPVVIIDYLQILAPQDRRATDKQRVDDNVLELKRISRDYKIPLIGISSFNRENYNAPVSMASFKESGAIEYSSDVLIGMQVDGIERRPSEKDSEYKERVQKTLETVELCKRKGEPIAIEAKILKNRNGVPGSVHFEFYSRYNYFHEAGSSLL